MEMTKRFIFWGATGQAIVLDEIVANSRGNVEALFDNNSTVSSPLKGVPIFHGEKGFLKWCNQIRDPKGTYYFGVAIGGGHGFDRHQIFKKLANTFESFNFIHHKANLSESVILGEGVQILMNATVSSRAVLGDCSIVNTSASVDHECVLGAGVHIGPGAVLAGEVHVGAYSFIGAGAVVLPRIKVGSGSVVGAGAVVTKDVPDNVIVYGSPARVMKINQIF